MDKSEGKVNLCIEQVKDTVRDLKSEQRAVSLSVSLAVSTECSRSNKLFFDSFNKICPDSLFPYSLAYTNPSVNTKVI